MNYIKNIFFYLGVGFILVIASHLLKSSFLSEFLHDNIIVLLITLLAINTATSSLIISKLQDMATKYKTSFKLTYKELKISLFEQIIQIGLAIIFLVLSDSEVIKLNFQYHNFLFDILLTAVFVYSIDILRDTGKAIFEIIKVNDGESN